MNSFQIPTPKDFSFELCLEFLKRSPRELLHVCQESSVLKLIRVKESPIVFQVKMDGTNLGVTILNTKVTDDIKQDVSQYIYEWFDLKTDLTTFYSLADKDKILRNLVKKFYGYRIVGQPDLFESLVWAVLGQQINLQFAYTLKQRFVEKFGECFTFDQNAYFIFPSPAIVTGLTDNDLLHLQFSRQKSKYTIGIAEAFVSGQISKKKLQNLPLQEAKEELIKIKGVGNWTANYALMKTFHYPDAFPLEDAGVHNAIKNHLKLDRKPTLEEVRKVFKKYKGWEAYATLYLWKGL